MFPAGQVLPLGKQINQSTLSSQSAQNLDIESRNSKNITIVNTGNISINIQANQQPGIQELNTPESFGQQKPRAVQLPTVGGNTQAAPKNKSIHLQHRKPGGFFTRSVSDEVIVPVLAKTKDVRDRQNLPQL